MTRDGWLILWCFLGLPLMLLAPYDEPAGLFAFVLAFLFITMHLYERAEEG